MQIFPRLEVGRAALLIQDIVTELASQLVALAIQKGQRLQNL